MEAGNIVEYIDRQKIVCAVIMETKKQRVRLLTEFNREIKISVGRLSHRCRNYLDLSPGRDRLVAGLKQTASRRNMLAGKVDIKELWDVLNTEQEWIDLDTMTEFCFPENRDCDHEAAVVRAFFKDRLYFRFNTNRFFPNSQEHFEHLLSRIKEAERRKKMIEDGGSWLKQVLDQEHPVFSADRSELIDILKSCYLFEKESSEYALAVSILSFAGIEDPEKIFDIFVKLGIWDKNENIDLYRYEIPITFPDEIEASVAKLTLLSKSRIENKGRQDLTHLSLMTIDGQSTLDFDDALSIEERDDCLIVGVHIADVAEFVKKGDLLDREAITRGSSIYMADHKIPMLPTGFAEDLCSLRAGEVRPAISTMIRLKASGEIIDFDIIPSLIRVAYQRTYYDVNQVAEEDPQIMKLYDIAKKFRGKRLADGAVQITLPEVNTWINEKGELTVSRTNREGPGRMLVAELMIMANWMMAGFLAQRQMPVIFRSQAGPRERLYKEDGGTLFQNWMQRRHLSRFMLGCEPERHCGLGLNVYLTATSPIRKYFDLVTQRQLRAVFGMESPYTREQVRNIIHLLELPMGHVSRIQYRRNRYWLLKYLEGRIGQREEAMVLYRRRNNYIALIPEYMIECELPVSSRLDLKPEDLIQIKIQYVNARKNIFSVFMG
ncbi:MAG: RNB domain-containing ribonuclease [Deltaproteobacteria bacterium]|nr:RNB domain-containing ribonuclease [Deltaproteobacteria bacterium]